MTQSLRDGTSQRGRVLPELDPDYAKVDERTTADLLAFAREYGSELKYFAPEDPDETHETWSGFIGPDTAQPRPHLALFLAFLELLGHARAQLNGLTGRHLEFFYRDVLRMLRKRAVPAKVHVLVDLDNRTGELLLPAGTALNAGKDSLGRDLVYRTDRDLVANHVEVARISSVHAQIRTTGIREARENPVSGAKAEDAFVAMLRIALGQPDPGDPLPVPVYPGVPAAAAPNQPAPEVTFAVLTQAQNLVGMVEAALGMPLYDDFRALMRLRQLRQAKDAADWAQINAILEKAGKARARDPNYKLAVADPAGFQANLRAALGKSEADFARLYDGLPEVKSIEEAYAVYLKRPDVQAFIQPPLDAAARNSLYLSLDDFRTMMQTKTLMDNQWSEINRLLEAAATRKRNAPEFKLAPETRASRNFDDKLNAALNAGVAGAPKFEFPGGIDAFFKAFLAVERYFYMPAESFKYIMAVAAQEQTARADARSWDRVYEIVAGAHREMIYAKRRESPSAAALPEPVAEKREWRNLYPAEDAKTVAPRSLQPGPGPLPRWKTFGIGEQPSDVQPAPPPASLGWAMASPLLELREGARTIELSLGFSADAPAFSLDENPLLVELSTEKGWLAPQSVKIAWAAQGLDNPKPRDAGAAKLRTLVFTLAFPESQPALAPLTREIHGIDTPAPVLRLMLKPVWLDKCYVTTSYKVLRRLSLVRTRLAVSAAGLAGLSIANDEATLDPKKPFEPFGSQPATGSRFYLGHPEVVGKKLDSLTFNIAWMGAPASFAEHYKNYPPDTLGNASFKAKVSLADSRVLKAFPALLQLFDANSTASVKATLTPPADQGNPAVALTAPADVTAWNRYVVWELGAPDFQHSAYPSVALKKSLQMATAATRPTDAAAYQVNPPYTPKIKSLTLDYASSAELVLDAAVAAPDAVRVFHVHPFGYAELSPEGDLPGCPFLPQYDFEGELYIGLRNVVPPQNLSLLFQIAEGTADPDLAPAPVQWSYLSANRWLSLQDGSLRVDGTRGLINSGIVELSLKPALPSTLLPGDLYWIRAAIARSPDSVCDLVEVHPNAVVATFADEGNAPDHLAEPLPAQRIAGPSTPVPGIERIRQPYTSFGGKMAEQDASFYVRVSERLRHKERALTAWDYERLVLEKFPQLYKVKCLRAGAGVDAREPGGIELIVIPDIRNRLPFNPFEPKAPADLIRDIETFLQDKTPPFAAVRVRNPHYVPVKVRCGVRFLPGQDEGFCRRRLNEELNRFLSPWAYEEGADLIIGGSVYANSIINFIDRRDYVDYIFEFKLFTSEDGGDKFNPVPPAEEGYRAQSERPDGVLVAAREHEFDVISQADYRVEGFAGVNYMRIELDFTVS